METELIIEGVNFPPFSARGCQQELSLVQHGTFRRTVNGDLCYLGREATKYKSTIWCEDKVTLVNEGVLMRGQAIRVGCLQRLWQQGVNRVVLERDAVAGSIVVMDAQQERLVFNQDERVVDVPQSDQKFFVSYRPWIHARVMALELQTDEWGLKAKWRLDVEEI